MFGVFYGVKTSLSVVFPDHMINSLRVSLCLFQVDVDMRSFQQQAGAGEQQPVSSHPALQLL